MIKNKKPPFERINYKPSIELADGNKAFTLAKATPKKTDKLTEEVKEDIRKAKETYEKYINVGMLWRPAGKGANELVVNIITFIHPKKCTVSWKQVNAKEFAGDKKPAEDRWPISQFLSMVKTKQIVFLG